MEEDLNIIPMLFSIFFLVMLISSYIPKISYLAGLILEIAMKKTLNLSGLQSNLDKTLVIPLGGNYDVMDVFCKDLNLIWQNNFGI